ncbi:MAG: hypothetical protein L3J76_05840, partial [Candidatus Hydrothermae bacterium]|nr:hypothetical protein [Candidatus Hydrothermae bacterium]
GRQQSRSLLKGKQHLRGKIAFSFGENHHGLPLCYGWQDRLMEALDRRFCPEIPPPSPRWMTLVSVHGLGFQLLWMVPFVWVGADRALLWSFIGWNLWALILLRLRCRFRLQQEDLP